MRRRRERRDYWLAGVFEALRHQRIKQFGFARRWRSNLFSPLEGRPYSESGSISTGFNRDKCPEDGTLLAFLCMGNRAVWCFIFVSFFPVSDSVYWVGQAGACQLRGKGINSLVRGASADRHQACCGPIKRPPCLPASQCSVEVWKSSISRTCNIRGPPMTSLTWREKDSRVSFNFFRFSGAKELSNDCSRPMMNSYGD